MQRLVVSHRRYVCCSQLFVLRNVRMPAPLVKTLPKVSLWRINCLRVIYLLIFFGLSSFVWQQLLFDSAEWPVMKGIVKSMMAALALLCLVGVLYPIQFLPVLIWEVLWKTIWILSIAVPAIDTAHWTVVESTFYECIGIIIVYFILPWNYIWKRYCIQPSEPWR